jgi:thiol-disulfide isomerase/thioredoxin
LRLISKQSLPKILNLNKIKITIMEDEEEYLLEFYGRECHFCREMEPLVKKLEEELGVKVKRIEVWHNAANAKLMEQFDKGFCGGVPFFFNKKTGKWICGATTYEKLKEWALGK